MNRKGNLGMLLKDLMEGVAAPTPAEVERLLAYLSQYGQQVVDPAQYPDLKATKASETYSEACP